MAEGSAALTAAGVREWARRLGASAVVRIVALVAVFVWYPLHGAVWFAMIDPDLWWHMRSGEWILQHHALPRMDPFSVTGAGHEWVAYSWVFGVLIEKIARVWDLRGVVGFTMVSWTVLTAALLWLVRRVIASFWAAAGLAALGGVVLERVVAPRPGNFSILLFMVVLGILVKSAKIRPFPKDGKDRAPERLPHNQRTVVWGTLMLVGVMWVWANLHLQFIYGLVVIGAFALVRRRTWLWVALGLSTLVTTVTPYGLGPWRVIWEFLHQPRQYGLVAEFHPMGFNRPVHYVILFLALVAAMCLARVWRRDPVWLLLFAFAAVQGFHMERDIWLLAIVSIMVIATWWRERETAPELVPQYVWLGAAACVLAVIGYSLATGPSNRELMGRVADEYPVGAVAYIHEHHLQGPIFNNFDWGGFLIYALPEFPVTMDGRTNVHDQQELAQSMDTWNLMGNWHEDPLLVRANLVIGSPKFALTHALALDPRFKMVFNDGVAVVYEKATGAEAQRF